MIESQTKWLVAALVPGVERQPLKKSDAHEKTLLKLLHGWRREAGQAGRNIKRIIVAYGAGRDGFWLARWLGGFLHLRSDKLREKALEGLRAAGIE